MANIDADGIEKPGKFFQTGALAFGVALALAPVGRAAEPPVINLAPTAKDWAAIAQQPDLSGVWQPALPKGKGPAAASLPPWTPEVAQQVAALQADEAAGRPHNIYTNCLPEGVPGFWIMTLNAVEFLATPGRITVLGEFDGNRLQRIWTDGRGHPADLDPSFHGHSIGHWEGGVLVVDTVGILPEVFLPLSQGVGFPNNGDLHVVARISLTGPDTLRVDQEITAPHVLTAPWKTTRIFTRTRERKYDLAEASCRQGDFIEDKDARGNAIYASIPHDAAGDPLPPQP